MPDFLPRKETDLRSWGANFTARIPPMVQRFNISQQLVDDCIAAYGRFRDALRVCQDPGTATVPATRVKTDALVEFKQAARVVAGLLRSQSQLSDGELVLLGLRQRRKPRKRIPSPATAPLLQVEHAHSGTIKVMVFDKANIWRIARPANTEGVGLVWHEGEHPPSTGWRPLKFSGSTRLGVDLPAHLPPGTRIWISAYWLGTRKQAGPLAAPVSIVIHERPMRLQGQMRAAA